MEGTMRLVANLFAALLVLLTAEAGSAQSYYPNRPVKILVGFTPGTAPDLAARILADRFAEVWGTPFVVENVPGAGSNIATERVAEAAADGYTLLMGGNSALVINPSLFEQLPFDPIKDFAPISQVFIAANVLAVPSEQPVKTVAELVALAKAQPGKLSYGHAGVGTSQHLGAVVQVHGACRYCAGALSRHHGVDAGPARQPHHHVVRQYRERGAVGARREIAGAGHHLH
jgi:tripartite-type tricarboxylate transporter receptor subunit TctC